MIKAKNLIQCAVLLWVAVGCSTSSLTPKPVPSTRKGFLDRIESPHGQSRPAKFKSLPRETVLEKQRRLKKAKPGKKSVPGQKAPDQKSDSPVQGNLNGGARDAKKAYFQWPVALPQITSHFGKRGGDFHDGIDLRAQTGTPVYAAQSGVVLYAAQGIRGYGELVVIRHEGKVSTIYGHNSRILVRRGQFVRKGERIALSGMTGHASGPHVHFEIRKGLSSVNPLKYLPGV